MNNRLSTNWEDFKSHMKNGGWKKGAAVASVAIVAPIVLAGCVLETQATEVVVQDKEFASFDQVQAFLGDEYSINQTIKETVEDYAKDTYGQNAKVFSVVSQGKNTLEGNIFAVVENEGKIHVLEIENNADLSMFKGKEYKADTYSFENNTLKFSVDGKEQTVDLAEIPYVYDGETGNLTTFENINSFENALSGAVKSANEIETLSNSMDASQKEIFNLVVSTFASENFKAQFPTINASYNAQTDTTTAEFKFAKGTNEITTMTFSFAGDVTNRDGTLNLDKVQVDKDTNYTQNTTTICDEYKEIYSNKDAVINSTEITKENEGEQGGESSVVIDQIQYNDLNEFFTNLSETELDNFKTSLSNAIIDNALTDRIIKGLFDKDTTKEDIGIDKFGINLDDQGCINNIQVLAVKNSETSSIKFSTAQISFNEVLNINDFVNVKKIKGSCQEIFGDNGELISLKDNTGKIIAQTDDYSCIVKTSENEYTFFNLNSAATQLSSENAVTVIKNNMVSFTNTPTQEQKDLFNLLMPYAVSEATNYSHITVSYASATDPSFGTCYSVVLSAYNENTNSYVKYNFSIDDNLNKNQTNYERMVEAVNNNDFYYNDIENKEMISGDIMLEMEENQDVYKIITIQEAKDIANLLMPHAVGENSYSLVSVGYENDEDPSFGAYFCAEIYAYNKDTKSHIKYRFIIKDSQENGKTEYQRMVDAVNKNNFTYTELSAELGTEKE